MKKEKCFTDIEIASPGPKCNYYGRDLAIIPYAMGGHLSPNNYDIDRDERAKDRHKKHLETKMILDLTKPAPPTYFPPRCGVPEEVVEAVNLEALQDYKGLQKVLKEVQRPESTLSRLCWGYSAFTTCQAAFQPFFSLARIMHRFSSRSDESAGLARRTGAPACGSGAPALAGRAGRADGFGAAVENLCMVRAKTR